MIEYDCLPFLKFSLTEVSEQKFLPSKLLYSTLSQAAAFTGCLG
jgi:hypothetical protein